MRTLEEDRSREEASFFEGRAEEDRSRAWRDPAACGPGVGGTSGERERGRRLDSRRRPPATGWGLELGSAEARGGFAAGCEGGGGAAPREPKSGGGGGGRSASGGRGGFGNGLATQTHGQLMHRWPASWRRHARRAGAHGTWEGSTSVSLRHSSRGSSGAIGTRIGGGDFELRDRAREGGRDGALPAGDGDREAGAADPWGAVHPADSRAISLAMATYQSCSSSWVRGLRRISHGAGAIMGPGVRGRPAMFAPVMCR